MRVLPSSWLQTPAVIFGSGSSKAPVIVGAHEEHELELLVNSGASTVLPESLEVSLVFGAQLLHSIGRSDEEVDSRIAELRAELYPSLQRRAK